mgnify:CR=1 FL=1
MNKVIAIVGMCGSGKSIASDYFEKIGYEKVYLLQNELNLSSSEVISTYVYKVGLEQSDFSYSTAVGLFNTAVNCIFIFAANSLSKKIAKIGLFS